MHHPLDIIYSGLIVPLWRVVLAFDQDNSVVLEDDVSPAKGNCGKISTERPLFYLQQRVTENHHWGLELVRIRLLWSESYFNNGSRTFCRVHICGHADTGLQITSQMTSEVIEIRLQRLGILH